MNYLKYIEQTKSQKTLEDYRNRLRYFLRWKLGNDTCDVESYPWHRVSGNVIRNYASHLKSNYPLGNARAMFSPLRGLINYLVSADVAVFDKSAELAVNSVHFTEKGGASNKEKLTTVEGIKANLSASSAAKFVSSLNSFIRWSGRPEGLSEFPWDLVTRNQLNEYVHYLGSHYKSNSVLKNYVSSLRQLYLHLSENSERALQLFRHLKSVDLSSIKESCHELEVLSDDDIRVIDSSAGHGTAEIQRGLTCASLLLHSGFSLKEAVNLRFSGTKSYSGHPTLVRPGRDDVNLLDTQSDTNIHAKTLEQINAWISHRGIEEGVLLCPLSNDSGQPIVTDVPLSHSTSVLMLKLTGSTIGLGKPLKAKVLKNTYKRNQGTKDGN